MDTKLEFYKIKKGYLQYLTDQNIKVADKLFSPVPYLGVVFQKDSINSKNIKFYVPCSIPTKRDFIYDEQLKAQGLPDWQCRAEASAECLYRFPLISENWTAKNECNIVMTLKLADMLPVPDDMVEKFDIWNDISVPEFETRENREKSQKAMYARFKIMEEDVLSDSFNVDFIMDTCINFYGRQIRLEIGDYDPFDLFPEDYAKKENKALTTIGNYGTKAEVECLVFQSPEYQKYKALLDEGSPIKAKLANKDLVSLKDSFQKKLIGITKEERNKPSDKTRIKTLEEIKESTRTRHKEKEIQQILSRIPPPLCLRTGGGRNRQHRLLRRQVQH